MRGEIGFPWPILALTQAYYIPVTQLASVGGIALVSAFVFLLNVLFLFGFRKRRTLIITMIIILLVFTGGYVRFHLISSHPAHEPTLARVAIAQGNVDPALKWELGTQHSYEIYRTISQTIANEDIDLLVWPETAFPGYLKRHPYWRYSMQNFVDSLGVPIATGASHYEFIDSVRVRYNPAFLVRPGGREIFRFYAKNHLVPFGERVPFQVLFPDLGKLNFGQAEFTPGGEVVVWPVSVNNDTIFAAPLICYEAVFPYISRQAALDGAQFLLNMTNDGWLQGTTEPEQHLLLSSFRSIETGRSLVRSTNTGISGFVTPAGQILDRLPEGIRGAVFEDIYAPVETFYLKGGWLLAL